MTPRRLLSALLLVAFTQFTLPRIARAAGDPARFAGEIQAMLRQDATLAPPRHGIVFFGSSSFRLWTNLASTFPGLPVINRGFGGSQLSDLDHYLDTAVVPLEPSVLLIYGGDNDLAAGVSVDQFLADFDRFREHVRRVLPRTRVGFLAIKPSPSRRKLLGAQQSANTAVALRTANDPQFDFLDVASPLLDAQNEPRPELFQKDLLHLAGAGYALWQTTLTPWIRRQYSSTSAGPFPTRR